MKGLAVAVLVGMAGCGMLFAGCGGGAETQKRVDAEAEDTALVPEPEGKTEEPAVSGLASKLPEGFPRDIPLYAGAEHVRSEVRPDGMASVWVDSEDDEQTVIAFYKDALPNTNWLDRGTVEDPAGGTVMTFRRDDDRLTVKTTPKPEKTRIRLSVERVVQTEQTE
jgi:hypothetical protein